MFINNNSLNTRSTSLDALRGFALFGVLVANIFLVNSYTGDINNYLEQYPGRLDQLTGTVVKYFFRGRFYPIFTFLFGLGMGIQFFRQKTSKSGLKLLLRRLVVLTLIGVLHYVLIWDGDILIRYSLVGLFILTIIPLRKNLILFSAVFVYILHSIYALQLNAPPILPVQADAPITHSTYLQLVFFRTKEIFVSYSTIDSFFYSVKVLSFMLFGLYCSSLLTLPRQNKFNWPTMLMLLVSIRMATAILSFVLQGSEADIIISFLNYLLTPSIYVTALLTLTTIEALKGVIFFFSSVGRMSLTNYLLQNLVMTFIFYSYGLDQYQKWQPWQLLAFAVLLFLVQGYISSLWLQYQNQGPVEKLWRYFTYERQAKRKAQLK